MAPEVLFDPAIEGRGEKPGLHRLVYNSIKESDLDLQRELYQNIILSGGSSMFKNLPQRLQ